jgi:GTP:adenosylcobinamide-phosphate guanylyltransferase
VNRAEPVPAVVLAGRPNQGALRRADGAPWEALIPIGGQPMVGHVLSALASAEGVAGGLVVGPPELTPLLPNGFARVEPGRDVIDHLARALPILAQTHRRVLVAGSDVPLVTAAMVDRFLAGCGDQSLDVYFPVVRRETAEARYPQVRRTYVRLRDGAYTAGNLYLVNPRVLIGQGDAEGLLARLVRWRKSPWRMARVLGPGVLLALVLHTLDLAAAERRVAARVGVTGRAVVLDDPEVGLDVDKPADLVLCREVLSHAGS